MRKTFRKIVKGLTWRLFAAVDTTLVLVAVTLFKTGHVGFEVLATVVGVVGMETITKTGLFTVHEWLWERYGA